MGKKVAIFGGGVGGLTAAHELVERGFDVDVYDLQPIPGGKARSTTKDKSGTGTRRDLPGEHGFRFVPGFYKHLPDTMRRIPYGKSGKTVFDNLVATTHLQFPRPGQFPITLLDSVPKFDLLGIIYAVIECLEIASIPFEPDEPGEFAMKLFQIATSCRDRRLDEYEKIGWWAFLDASSHSKAYQQYLAVGLTRSLNACKAQYASTKTIGDIIIQLFMDMAAGRADFVLNGPTNDVWIVPWRTHLEAKGARYHPNSTLKLLEVNQATRCIDGAIVMMPGKTDGVQVVADYYIVAIPIEKFAEMLEPLDPKDPDNHPAPLVQADPSLAGILAIKQNVQWMNGIQYYLNTPFQGTSPVRGHLLFAETPWALTAVGQAQFWPDFPMSEFGAGNVQDILSVDISEWEKPGLPDGPAQGKPAWDCSREEIRDETWAQLKASLNYTDALGKHDILTETMRVDWSLDEDIQRGGPDDPHFEVNAEPLLVNYINSWSHRPDAYTRIANLYLAADYVRTFTDLATMEGANEAARRAVNAICSREGRTDYCALWQLEDAPLLEEYRRYDQERFDCGLPWKAWDQVSSCYCGPLSMAHGPLKAATP